MVDANGKREKLSIETSKYDWDEIAMQFRDLFKK